MRIRKLAAVAAAAVLSVSTLSACSSPESTAPAPGTEQQADASAKTSEQATELDVEAYDSILASGPIAEDSAIEANKWASAIKKAGVLKIGGVNTSTLFSLESIDDGETRGFDAGLSDLLARYILGEDAKTQLTAVTSSTREEVLVNGTVDAVFATYSINDERKKKIDFAGPYFVVQQGILVKASNTDINGVDDLAGKNVAVQAGSTGPQIVAEFAPEAKVKEYQSDEEIQEALAQGRVDAYVVDNTLLASAVVERPEDFKLVGEPFGPEDPYGIGLPKDSDAAEFVNAFLKEIEESGQWADLWQVTIGDRTGQDTIPEIPALEG